MMPVQRIRVYQSLVFRVVFQGTWRSSGNVHDPTGRLDAGFLGAMSGRW